MKIHEACKIFPALSSKELQDLANDIKQYGLLHKIATYNGEIIDGRNRFNACKMAEVEPQFEAVGDAPNFNPWAFVVSTNVRRRQLNVSQITIACSKIPSLGVGRPAKQLGSAAQLTGEQIAKENGVSPRAVKQGRRVHKKAPELVSPIEDGLVTVNDASSISDEPEPVRKAALDAVEKGESKTLKAAVKKITGGTAFNTDEFDDVPEPPKPSRNGKPVVSSKDRAEATKALGVLIRALNKVGIYDEFVKPLSQLTERLQSI